MNPVIAVVDHDQDILAMMEILLTWAGYEPLLWQCAEDAYELIRRKQPDLVILDLHVEHREAGWMLLNQLRLDPVTAHVPAIMYSCDRDFLRQRARVLRAKGCAILAKPFDPQALLRLIEQTLRVPVAQ